MHIQPQTGGDTCADLWNALFVKVPPFWYSALQILAALASLNFHLWLLYSVRLLGSVMVSTPFAKAWKMPLGGELVQSTNNLACLPSFRDQVSVLLFCTVLKTCYYETMLWFPSSLRCKGIWSPLLHLGWKQKWSLPPFRNTLFSFLFSCFNGHFLISFSSISSFWSTSEYWHRSPSLCYLLSSLVD